MVYPRKKYFLLIHSPENDPRHITMKLAKRFLSNLFYILTYGNLPTSLLFLSLILINNYANTVEKRFMIKII
jgi:hypothetical protein